MTNLELVYMLTVFNRDNSEYNKLCKLIKENNLDYLFKCNKEYFKKDLNHLLDGCYEINLGDINNEKN